MSNVQAAFVCLGFVALFLSGLRYFKVARAFERQEYLINTGGISLMLGVTAAVVLVAIIIAFDYRDSHRNSEIATSTLPATGT